MKSVILYIIFGILVFISCTEKSKTKNIEQKIYVISKEDSIQNLSFQIEYPDYAQNNFIIGNNNKVYFYRTSPVMICIPQKKHPPEFIDLKPNDIIELPVSSIGEFVHLNFGGESRRKSIISIASFTDTIKSDSFKHLLSSFATEKIAKYFIRRTTLEEEIVLIHKTKDLFYFPEEVNWDTTRINFSLKEDVENILKISQEKFKKE
ncbi:hypothetical protein [uncultured Flavobacterium sp.]|uniref:hypothetical protein n=1 Tax=uncultured Flavobacterium sp. TaxID=165435 RepID=UPI0025FFBBCF|nr:hypothetical protein [uncultured Flavobacterium sp.]